MTDCICEGNWRAIVKEYALKIGGIYNAHDGSTFRFYGLVHADDDYYYGLCELGTGKTVLVSCVIALESCYDPVLVN